MLNMSNMEWTIEYYSEKVRLGVEGWPVGIRAFYARTIERMRTNGPNIGMPFTRPMGDGLFEIRAIGREGIGRAFFCTVVGRKIVILHEFIKKSDRTPKREIETALKKLQEIKNEKD